LKECKYATLQGSVFKKTIHGKSLKEYLKSKPHLFDRLFASLDFILFQWIYKANPTKDEIVQTEEINILQKSFDLSTQTNAPELTKQSEFTQSYSEITTVNNVNVTQDNKIKVNLEKHSNEKFQENDSNINTSIKKSNNFTKKR